MGGEGLARILKYGTPTDPKEIEALQKVAQAPFSSSRPTTSDSQSRVRQQSVFIERPATLGRGGFDDYEAMLYETPKAFFEAEKEKRKILRKQELLSRIQLAETYSTAARHLDWEEKLLSLRREERSKRKEFELEEEAARQFLNQVHVDHFDRQVQAFLAALEGKDADTKQAELEKLAAKMEQDLPHLARYSSGADLLEKSMKLILKSALSSVEEKRTTSKQASLGPESLDAVQALKELESGIDFKMLSVDRKEMVLQQIDPIFSKIVSLDLSECNSVLCAAYMTSTDQCKVNLWHARPERRELKLEKIDWRPHEANNYHTGRIASMVIAPQEHWGCKQILSGGFDTTLRLWEHSFGSKDLNKSYTRHKDQEATSKVVTMRGHTEIVNGVAFIPGTQYFVSGSSDNTLRVWKIKPGALGWGVLPEEEWVDSPPNLIKFPQTRNPPHTNGQGVFIDSTKTFQFAGTIVEWQLDVLDPGKIRLQVWRCVDPGIFILIGENKCTCNTRGPTKIIPDQPISFQPGDCIGWERAGEKSGVISYDTNESAGTISTGRRLQLHPSDKKMGMKLESSAVAGSYFLRALCEAGSHTIVHTHESWVLAVAASKDFVVTALKSGHLWWFSVKDLDQRIEDGKWNMGRLSQNHDKEARCVAISGEIAMSGSEDGSVYVWDILHAKAAISRRHGHKAAVYSIKIHGVAKERRAVSADVAGVINVWLVTQDACLLTYNSKKEFDALGRPQCIFEGNGHWMIYNMGAKIAAKDISLKTPHNRILQTLTHVSGTDSDDVNVKIKNVSPLALAVFNAQSEGQEDAAIQSRVLTPLSKISRRDHVSHANSRCELEEAVSHLPPKYAKIDILLRLGAQVDEQALLMAWSMSPLQDWILHTLYDHKDEQWKGQGLRPARRLPKSITTINTLSEADCKMMDVLGIQKNVSELVEAAVELGNLNTAMSLFRYGSLQACPWASLQSLSPVTMETLRVHSKHESIIDLYFGSSLYQYRDPTLRPSDQVWSAVTIECKKCIVTGDREGRVAVHCFHSQNPHTFYGEGTPSQIGTPEGNLKSVGDTIDGIQISDYGVKNTRPRLAQDNRHTAAIHGLAYTRRNETLRLYSASADTDIRIWDVDEHDGKDAVSAPRCIQVLSVPTDWVRAISAAPSGQFFASGGDDCLFRQWDTNHFGEEQITSETNIMPPLETDLGASLLCMDMVYPYVVTGCSDGTIRLWECGREAALLELGQSIPVHYDGVTSVIIEEVKNQFREDLFMEISKVDVMEARERKGDMASPKARKSKDDQDDFLWLWCSAGKGRDRIMIKMAQHEDARKASMALETHAVLNPATKAHTAIYAENVNGSGKVPTLHVVPGREVRTPLMIVSGGGHGDITIHYCVRDGDYFDVVTHPLKTDRPHKAAVSCLSLRGEILASASATEIRIWDVYRRFILHTLPAFGSPICYLSLSGFVPPGMVLPRKRGTAMVARKGDFSYKRVRGGKEAMVFVTDRSPNLETITVITRDGTMHFLNPVTVMDLDDMGQTMIHKAAAVGNCTLLEAILEVHADRMINTKDKDGNTALHIAVKEGKLEAVKTLIKSKYINPDLLNKEHVPALAFATDDDIIEILIKDPSFNIYARQPITQRSHLHVAVAAQNKKLVNRLILGGLDVNATDKDDKTPLFLSALKPPCQRTVENPHPFPIANDLTNHGASTNQVMGKNGWTIMHWIAKELHEPWAVTFLDKILPSADPNVQAKDRSTPLALACENADVLVCEWLIDKGADIQGVDISGQGPLHRVARNSLVGKADDRVKIIEFLTEAAARKKVNIINDQTSDGDTALHCAIYALGDRRTMEKTIHESDRWRVVWILLCNGADPDIRNVKGFAPTHLAAKEAGVGLEVLQLLLKAGANIDIQNPNTLETPYMLALQKRNDLAKRYLASCGADVFIPRAYAREIEADQEDEGTRGTHSWLSPKLPIFFIYMIYHGFIAYPWRAGYHYFVGTRMTKILNYGIEIYDNEPQLPNKISKRLMWLGYIGASLLYSSMFLLPLAVIALAVNGYYEQEGVLAYLAVLIWLETILLFKAYKDRLFFSVNHAKSDFVLFRSPEEENVLGMADTLQATLDNNRHLPKQKSLLYGEETDGNVMVRRATLTLAGQYAKRPSHIIEEWQAVSETRNEGNKLVNLSFFKLIKHIKFGNVPPLLAMVIDFLTYSAFAFNSAASEVHQTSEVSSENESEWKKFLDSIILNFGSDTYSITLYLTIAGIAFWFLVHAYIISIRCILRNPDLNRRIAPFVKLTSLDPAWMDITVGLFTGTFYSIFTKALFQALDCTEYYMNVDCPGEIIAGLNSTINGINSTVIDGVVQCARKQLVLDVHPDIVCWEGKHIGFAFIAMYANVIYLTSAQAQAIYFREPRSADARDIQYIGFFILLDIVVKTIIAGANVMLSSHESAIFRVNFLSMAIMLIATITLKPCRDIRLINFLRIGVYGCSFCSVLISYLMKLFPNEIQITDAILLWSITIAMTWMWYKRVPLRKDIINQGMRGPSLDEYEGILGPIKVVWNHKDRQELKKEKRRMHWDVLAKGVFSKDYRLMVDASPSPTVNELNPDDDEEKKQM